MESGDLKTKASVSKEMWESHIVKQLQKGKDLTIWPKRAQISIDGRLKAVCMLSGAKKVVISGIVEKIGKSSDGEGERYKLKAEFIKGDLRRKKIDDWIEEEEEELDAEDRKALSEIAEEVDTEPGEDEEETTEDAAV